MFGGKFVAGSHLINLRRQRASFKSTQTLTESSSVENSNPNLARHVKTYVIPGFAKFEFRPRSQQELNIDSKAFPHRMHQVNKNFRGIKSNAMSRVLRYMNML